MRFVFVSCLLFVLYFGRGRLLRACFGQLKLPNGTEMGNGMSRGIIERVLRRQVTTLLSAYLSGREFPVGPMPTKSEGILPYKFPANSVIQRSLRPAIGNSLLKKIVMLCVHLGLGHFVLAVRPACTCVRFLHVARSCPHALYMVINRTPSRLKHGDSL